MVSLPLAKDFGDCLAMDIKVYDAKNNICFHHMIDHATRFSVATLLKSKVRRKYFRIYLLIEYPYLEDQRKF